MTEKEKKELALAKFSIISPLVTNYDNYLSNTEFFNLASKQEIIVHGTKKSFSPGTIQRWYYDYKKGGFDSLIPKKRIDIGRRRTVDDELIEEIKQEIIKHPRKCAKQIYQEKKLIGKCSYNTINRVYQSIKKDINLYTPTKDMRRYECPYFNDVWCADSSVGPYLYKDKKKIKLYIIAFIDDASRVITGCKIFDSDNTYNLISTLKSAVSVYGKPKTLNVDNGRNYKSKQTQTIAAKVGISMHYDPIKTPTSKSKIERFFRTLKDHWTSSIDYHDFKSIDEFQASLSNYINQYNNTIHSSLNGLTPLQRKDKDNDKIIYLTKEDLNDKFLLEIERKASFDSIVMIDEVEYEVPSKFAARRVKIRFSYDFTKVYILDNNTKIEIKKVNKIENSMTKRKGRLTDE